MNTLLTMLGTFLSWIRSILFDLIGLVMPLFSTERLERMAATLWFTLHILAVLGIAALLYWLDNNYWGLWEMIRPVRAPLWVARAWLAILWLLVYAVLILCYILYKLITSEQVSYYFPDIDEAWKLAVAALNKQNLELKRLPMFLVLGRAEAGDDVLFTAAGLPLELRQSPPGDHPVHVYATAKAIYVTCPGASVLGALSSWLHGDAAAAAPGVEEEGAGATLRPGQGAGGGGGQSAEIAAMLARAGGNPANLGPVDRRELRRMDRKDNRQKAAARTPESIDLESARLSYLCGLMSRDRAPLCPINGILVLVPFAGLDSEQDAAFVADACDRDLRTVRQGTGQHCQVLALVCDMESAPGFAELVSRFPESQRKSRVGQGMALVAQLREKKGEESPAAGTLASLARWVTGGVMRYWVLTKCQLEKNVGTVVPEGFDLNTQLFALLHEMTERQAHLATVLGKGFSGYAAPERLLFGGCYLAGTGRAAPQQAFVADVFDKLAKGEEHVYWTDEVLNEEYRLNGWINFGWLVLTLGVLGAAGFAVYLVYFRA